MKIRFFTKEQRTKIFDWLDTHRDDECALLLDILATTGCRVDELMRIQFSDINRHDALITIQHGSKGSESRTRRLAPELINALYRFKESRALTDHDFVSDIMPSKSHNIETKKKMLSRYFEILRYTLFKNQKLPSLHGFRHTKALMVYEQNPNVYAVKIALGHKSISSTDHYMTFVEEDKLRDVFFNRT
jgi:integrase